MNTSYNPVQPLQWELGCGENPTEYFPSTVPGACQLDLAGHLNLPDYRYADNCTVFRQYEGLHYRYRSHFERPKAQGGKSVWFVSKGIDYRCAIFLNGKFLAGHEGMMSPIEVLLDEFLCEGTNTLEILIFPHPKKASVPTGREEASDCCKPPVSYEWDWHPRLIPSGIWDETGIQIRGGAWIDHVSVNYNLADDFSSADIDVNTSVNGRKQGVHLIFSLYDETEEEVLSLSGDTVSGLRGSLASPNLWWTHDYGHPYLYRYSLQLIDAKGVVLDKASGKTGFRTIEMAVNGEVWERLKTPLKSRSEAPSQIVLNGRKIFAKGANWVAPEIFPGVITPERYTELLEIAVATNLNILRCWGGCAASKDFFYEECNRLGILVWQEFPLACNKYPGSREYLAVLSQEATAVVKRIKNNPCLAILCGGNELFNSWSGMNDQSLPLRLLNKICFELAPEIPFMPTSPLNGMSHGYYLFRDNGMDVFQWMGKSDSTAYNEFGIPSIAPEKVLRNFVPENELFPVKPTPTWILHHAFGAWDGNMDTWLAQKTIEYYFGESDSLASLIDKSTLLQSEGYKEIYEEARRQKPICSMALCWMFNEPWPTAANNSIVSYPAVPKESQKAVANACRPICASAKFPKFEWQSGETLSFGMWLLNDSYDSACKRFSLTAYLVAPDGTETELLSWMTEPVKDFANIMGPVVRSTIPDWAFGNRFMVKIRVSGHPEMDSEYRLCYRYFEKQVTNAMNK